MKIFPAVERLPVVIPISDVFGADGSFGFHPEVTEKGYFDIDYRKNELILVAGKYIGQIPLTDNIAINVSPKFPISNLARIVGVSRRQLRCLDFFRRKYDLSAETSNSLQEAMARSLVASLRELASEGVYREYVIKHATISGLRGRLDIKGYIRDYVGRGAIGRVPCSYFDLTADTLANRIIKRAIYQIGSVLSVNGADKKLLKELEYFSDYFDAVPLDFSDGLLSRALEYLERAHVPQLRAYYLDILDVCSVILSGEGVELGGSAGPRSMHSLVVNLEELFESYVRRTLQVATEEKRITLPVYDGNDDAKKPLFDNTKQFDAKPDLVIGELGKPVVIGDVKYKTKVNESDRYQLISHALSYGVSDAFFVSPANDSKSAGSSLMGVIGGERPIRIHHLQMWLEDEHLQDAETRLITDVAALISVEGAAASV